jgi:hypothetical protein
MTPLLRSPSQLVNPLARQRFLGFGTAPGGAAAFNPLSLSPSTWLDASQETLTNGDAAQPLDFSGNGRQFKNTTSTRRPTFTTGLQNGRPGFVFDGVDDYVLPDAGLAVKWVFLVAKHNGATFPGFSGFYNTLNSGGGDHTMIGNSGGTALFAFPGSLGTVTYRLNRAVSAGRAAPMNAAGLMVAKFGNAISSALRQGLGGDRLLAGRWFNGTVFEHLEFTADLAEADCAALENYLAAKWGTP